MQRPRTQIFSFELSLSLSLTTDTFFGTTNVDNSITYDMMENTHIFPLWDHSYFTVVHTRLKTVHIGEEAREHTKNFS